MAGVVRTGCSSWTSESWWGPVYRTDLAPGERLSAYAQRYDTVEVDTSYYRDPGAPLVRRWRKATPDGFVFAMKFPRELLDPKLPTDREKIAGFESHARELGPKLGPILLQFPPWVKPGRAGPFLRELLGALDPELRHAVELRDAGWFRGAEGETLRRELRDRRIALAWSSLTYVDVPAELTTDFVYLRFIGDHTTVPAERHGTLLVDRSVETKRWAARVAAVLDRVENVFAYFNNHFAGFAPASVNLFRADLGLEPIDYGPDAAPPPAGGRQLRLP